MKLGFLKNSASTTMAKMTRTVFRFGLLGRAPHGFMSLGPDGEIRGYSNPQENRYTYENGKLSFFSVTGVCTSDFAESRKSELVFTPLSVGRHVLEPVFSLGPLDPPENLENRPAVFVNTMAKAGTYLVAQALQEVGYVGHDLHLSSHHFHDNRGIPDDEIHWDPNARRVACDAASVAALIRPGEFMVGHVDDLEQLNKIREMGIEIITVVRHPFDQIASMMNFKELKTKPKPEDKVWQSMTGIDRFKCFLLVHDTNYWLSFAKTVTANFPFFRFEDLLEGDVQDVGLPANLLADLKAGIEKAKGKKTSTYIESKRSDVREFYKDPIIKTYFEESGLTDFADRYWPDVSVG